MARLQNTAFPAVTANAAVPVKAFFPYRRANAGKLGLPSHSFASFSIALFSRFFASLRFAFFIFAQPLWLYAQQAYLCENSPGFLANLL
jgi:hypothetical protein